MSPSPVRRRGSASGASRLTLMLAFFAAFVLTAAMLPGQESDSGAGITERINAYVTGEMTKNGIPGLVVAVVAGGEVVHLEGYGRSGLDASRGGAEERMTPATPVQLGSATKTITAMALVQLDARGVLSLDDRVAQYLPSFDIAPAQEGAEDRGGARSGSAAPEGPPALESRSPRGPADITIAQLLSHESGIPADAGFRADGLSGKAFEDAASGGPVTPVARRAQAVAALLAEDGLEAAPGERFIYSRANYDVAGAVLEAATGSSYPVAVRKQVWEPLGMAACRVDAPATGSGSSTGRRSAEEPPRAVGHARGLFEITLRRIVDVPAAESASAGIVCSGEASARYLTALLGAGDAPIDASVRETLFAPRVVAEGPGVGEDAFYTLGWLREGYGADTVLWHTGSALTTQAAFRIYPEQGIGVFAAANVNGPMLYGFANQLAAGVYDTLEGREGQPFRTLEMARTTRVVVTAATSASLLWLLVSINAFRLRRRRRALPVRGRRDILRVVGLPLVVDALVLLFFFSGVPAGFQVGFLELSAVALDLFMLGLLAGVPVAVWAVARTALLLGSPKPRRR